MSMQGSAFTYGDVALTICVSSAQHPVDKLHFLLGKQGSEPCVIGGNWEPADGPHPSASPQALVATAMRTFKDATGLDLSACSQW